MVWKIERTKAASLYLQLHTVLSIIYFMCYSKCVFGRSLCVLKCYVCVHTYCHLLSRGGEVVEDAGTPPPHPLHPLHPLYLPSSLFFLQTMHAFPSPPTVVPRRHKLELITLNSPHPQSISNSPREAGMSRGCCILASLCSTVTTCL